MQQQSQEWFDARTALVTSSEYHKLMGVKSLAPDAELADTAKTYIREKYAELTTGLVKTVNAWQMDWGKENEPIAKAEMETMLSTQMKECEFIRHKERYYMGGSPDGFVVITSLYHCVEIKCPANTAEQYNNIELSRNPLTLKKDYPLLYWQLQNNMRLLTEVYGYDTKHAIFVSFDKRIKLGKGRYHQMILERNDADIAVMNQQLNKAWEYYKSLGEADGVDVAFLLHPDNEEHRKAMLVDSKASAARTELADLQKRWDAEKSGATQLTIHDQVNGSPIKIHDQI